MADEAPDPVPASSSARTRPKGRRPETPTPKPGGSGLIRIAVGRWYLTIPLAAVLGTGGVAALRLFPADDATLTKLEQQVGELEAQVQRVEAKRAIEAAEARAERTLLNLRLADLQKQCER